MASLLTINEDCIRHILEYLDLASVLALSYTSKAAALLAEHIRFQYLFFSGRHWQRKLDPERLKECRTHVLAHNLAGHVRRITMGTRDAFTLEGHRFVGLQLFSFENQCLPHLKELIIHARGLRALRLHCNSKPSMVGLLTDPEVLSALATCPLSELSITGVTTVVLDALRSFANPSIRRIQFDCARFYRNRQPVPSSNISDILNNFSARLTHLTLFSSYSATVWHPLENPITFPCLHSLTWEHKLPIPYFVSPADFHRCVPALRSLTSYSSLFTRSPSLSDFPSGTVPPVAVSGDGKFVAGYALLGAQTAMLRLEPRGSFIPLSSTDSTITLRSLCLPMDSLFPMHESNFENGVFRRVGFLQVYRVQTTLLGDIGGSGYPAFLDNREFPLLSYLCLHRRWKLYVEDSDETMERMQREELDWTSSMMQRLTELSSSSMDDTLPPVTVEFRVVVEDSGKLMVSWYEVVAGRFRRINDEEGMIRRESQVDGAHFL